MLWKVLLNSPIFIYRYTNPLFRTSLARDLEEDDIYEVVKSCDAKINGDRLEKEWLKQREKGKTSLISILWKCFGWNYLFLGLISLCWKLLTRYKVYISQKRILRTLFIQYFRATSNIQTSLLLQSSAKHYNLSRSHFLRRIKNRIESEPRNDNAELFHLYATTGNQNENGFLLFGVSKSVEAYS